MNQQRTDQASQPKTRRVLVAYHFFAHYRGGIIETLSQSRSCDYVFYGDEKDPAASGIRAYTWKGGERRIAARSKFYGAALFQWRLLALCASRQFDAIVFLGDPHYVTTWIGAIVARVRGTRVLFWTQGWQRSAEKSITSIIRDAFLRIPHGLLLYGDRAQVIGRKKGHNPESLYVIYNSLPALAGGSFTADLTSRSEVRRRQANCEESAVLLICPGRLIQNRRVDLLIRASAILAKSSLRSAIVLIGDGPERSALERLARELGVKVTFVGECYDEDVLSEWFYAADVTVIPHRSGLSVLQSLAFGTPVLVGDDPESEMPEWEAIEPGTTGAFYRDGDASDLARAIGAWVTRAPSREIVRDRCRYIVTAHYSPEFQRAVIERAVRGEPSAQIRRGPGEKNEADHDSATVERLGPVDDDDRYQRG